MAIRIFLDVRSPEFQIRTLPRRPINQGASAQDLVNVDLRESNMNSIKVRYENGVFKPVRTTELIEEGAVGEVHIQQKKARPSVRASEFFGLWKNRKDIKDGLSYVRKLRSESRYSF
jgi:predicted DNA-binding antitoxin AbrB/MazE fold protein